LLRNCEFNHLINVLKHIFLSFWYVGGKLPVTWYPQDYIKVPMTDMRMRPSSGYPGRTYRFYKGEKVFDFGYGLSYSKFAYDFSSVSKSVLHLNQSSATLDYKLVSELGPKLCDRKKVSVTVGVKNQGEMAGKHPVLLFLRKEKPVNGSPFSQLVGFQSVFLKAGERAEVEFVLSPCEHLSRANEVGLMVMEPGLHFLVVGEEEYPLTLIV
jgi:hypothetical protein